jgi:hypothetical protein
METILAWEQRWSQLGFHGRDTTHEGLEQNVAMRQQVEIGDLRRIAGKIAVEACPVCLYFRAQRLLRRNQYPVGVAQRVVVVDDGPRARQHYAVAVDQWDLPNATVQQRQDRSPSEDVPMFLIGQCT